MNDIEHIKAGIEKLYNTDPEIHFSLRQTHPRQIIDKAPARIVGVYKSIFRVEERESNDRPTYRTFQYSEVLIGQVTVHELEYTPTPITTKK